MIRAILLTAAIVFLPSNLAKPSSKYTLWNVGQGQWFTYIGTHQCLHIDMGGEKFRFELPLIDCFFKDNIALFTHFDWDHIRYAVRFANWVGHGKFCWQDLLGQKPPQDKLGYLRRIAKCTRPETVPIKAYRLPFPHTLSSNDSGVAYIVNNEVLILGDLSASAEKRLFAQFTPKKLTGLIVGHHGSQSSTDNSLLKTLSFRWAWISARKRVYGHPHKKTLQKLKRFSVPTFTTEVSGHLSWPAKIRPARRL